MKTYDEMAREVFQKGDIIIEERKAKRKKTAAVCAAAAVCVGICAFAVSGARDNPGKISRETTSSDFTVHELLTSGENGETEMTESYYYEQSQRDITITENPGGYIQPRDKTEESSSGNFVPKTESEKTESRQLSDGGETPVYGGPESGYFCIPVTPSNPASEKLNITGEKITDSEAKAYFEENRKWLESSLSSSGVDTADFRISEKGYSHVMYDGVQGKDLELRQNFRDYLAFSGDRLIAILTLYKEDGKLYCTPAFGAPWFSSYNSFLNSYKGRELLYVYAGSMEIIITPDNKCVNPMGNDVYAYMEGLDNPYGFFYNSAAVYVP